jgi:hypothetical protein
MSCQKDRKQCRIGISAKNVSGRRGAVVPQRGVLTAGDFVVAFGFLAIRPEIAFLHPLLVKRAFFLTRSLTPFAPLLESPPRSAEYFR